MFHSVSWAQTPADYKRATQDIAQWFAFGTAHYPVQSATPLGLMPTFFQSKSGMPYNLGFDLGYVYQQQPITTSVRNGYATFGTDTKNLETQLNWHRISLIKAINFRHDLTATYIFEPNIKLNGFGIGWKWNIFEIGRRLFTSLHFSYEKSEMKDSLASSGGHVDIMQSLSFAGLELYGGARYMKHSVSFDPSDDQLKSQKESVTNFHAFYGLIVNVSESLRLSGEFSQYEGSQVTLLKISYGQRSVMSTFRQQSRY